MAKATPKLERATFSTSRLMEYFTIKELKMQIGWGPERWPLAMTKELIDNALDSCEAVSVPPLITVSLEGDSVTVSDNGPGLPEETMKGSLDYTQTVSDKAHYISPTRGQLGNALKCLWAAPWVYNGERGTVEVVTSKYACQVKVSVDRIAQKPRLDLIPLDTPLVKTGTIVKTEWYRESDLASSIESSFSDSYNEDEDLPTEGEDRFPAEVLTLLQSYATFNPHAGFRFFQDGEETVISDPLLTDWEKWRPNWPTSPHWYTPDDLSRLIAAYISHSEGQKTVRKFVSEFRGLSSTAKQKRVVTAVGLSGQCLNDLITEGSINETVVESLWKQMCGESAPVKTAKLGIIGEETIAKRMQEIDGAGKVRYTKKVSESLARPTTVEMAFGMRANDVGDGRRVRFGLNFSPVISNPFKAWPVWLQTAMVDIYDPVCLTVHVVCPRFDFANRGKSMIGGDDE